jgi:hypothetical protein
LTLAVVVAAPALVGVPARGVAACECGSDADGVPVVLFVLLAAVEFALDATGAGAGAGGGVGGGGGL